MSAADDLMMAVLCASLRCVVTWEMQDLWGVWGVDVWGVDVCLKDGGGGVMCLKTE